MNQTRLLAHLELGFAGASGCSGWLSSDFDVRPQGMETILESLADRRQEARGARCACRWYLHVHKADLFVLCRLGIGCDGDVTCPGSWSGSVNMEWEEDSCQADGMDVEDAMFSQKRTSCKRSVSCVSVEMGGLGNKRQKMSDAGRTLFTLIA